MNSTSACRRLRAALLAGAALLVARPAAAQPRPAAEKVYSRAEQPPELPGGGGVPAVSEAISQRLRLPGGLAPGTMNDMVEVAFVVEARGTVRDIHITQGLQPRLDQAVVQAVQKLPRFVPGRQGGRPVAVSYSVRVVIPLTTANGKTVRASREQLEQFLAAPIVEAAPRNDSSKVYTYADPMPALPGGGGQAAIQQAIESRLVLPPDAAPGQVFVRFVVGPHGAVYDAIIVKGLAAGTDAAVLAAVRRLPRFVPGRLDGQPVAVSFLAVAVRIPAPKPAGR